MSNELTTQQQKNTFLSSLISEIGAEDYGQSNFSKYVSPPRIKIVQSTTQSDEIRNRFPVGSVIAVPALESIATIKTKPSGISEDFGEYFFMVPLFSWTEYCLWNPIEAKSMGLQAIRARTFDPQSDIAKKACSYRAEDKVFPCPELKEKQCRYVEHLNVLFAVQTPALYMRPHLYSFCRGSAKDGRQLATLLSARIHQGKMIPPFMNQFMFRSMLRIDAKTQQKYYAPEVSNPPEESFYVQDAGLREFYKSLTLKAKSDFDARILVANYEDDIDGAVVEGGVADSAKY